jgi:hypothetical protein
MIYISCLVYNQVWPNLPMDDHHLSYINKSFNKTLVTRQCACMFQSTKFHTSYYTVPKFHDMSFEKVVMKSYKKMMSSNDT